MVKAVCGVQIKDRKKAMALSTEHGHIFWTLELEVKGRN